MYVQVSKQQIFEANVLGWCIEWVSLPCPSKLSLQHPSMVMQEEVLSF